MDTTKTKQKGIGKEKMADVATMDELKQLGWRVEKLDSGWSAYEIRGERKIGPASSIKALSTQVKLVSGPPAAKDEGGRVKDEPAGNGKAGRPAVATEQRLPTMEEPEIDELNALADACLDLEEKKRAAKAASSDADDIMREKMREYGRKRYGRHGWSIVIEDSEKLVKKKDKHAGPKNPSTKPSKIEAM